MSSVRIGNYFVSKSRVIYCSLHEQARINPNYRIFSNKPYVLSVVLTKDYKSSQLKNGSSNDTDQDLVLRVGYDSEIEATNAATELTGDNEHMRTCTL